MMGIFAFLLNWSLNFKQIWRISLGSLIVLVIVTIEEISQIFIRGRTFSWNDLVADLLGIVIFGELGGLIVKRWFFR
jgi:VanZ family protein